MLYSSDLRDKACCLPMFFFSIAGRLECHFSFKVEKSSDVEKGI